MALSPTTSRGSAAVAAAYATYVPTVTASVTNPTLGSGPTQNGNWMATGKLVHAYGRIQLGAGATAGSGTYSILLPTPASTAAVNAAGHVGVCQLLRPGALLVNTYAELGDSTHFLMRHPAAWPSGASAVVTDAVPWAWQASDIIDFVIVYAGA